MNMVTPAMQLASKIPDVHVQLWASAILKGIRTRRKHLIYIRYIRSIRIHNDFSINRT